MYKKDMLKKATHCSATGESPDGLFNWLLRPFFCRQTKTIRQQFEEGVRLFDINVRKEHGLYRVVNGPFRIKKTLYDICAELNELCRLDTGTVYLLFNYDGPIKSYDKKRYTQELINIVKDYGFLELSEIIILDGGENIWSNDNNLVCFTCDYGTDEEGFFHIPYFSDKMFHNEKKFNEYLYNMVDFI